MKIIAIYKEESDHAREMREYLDEFERRTGFVIEVRDPEARENEFFLRAYDIVEYPTILAIEDDGRMLQMWRGRPLPLMDEVSYYAR
jgi:hypothetical protein